MVDDATECAFELTNVRCEGNGPGTQEEKCIRDAVNDTAAVYFGQWPYKERSDGCSGTVHQLITTTRERSQH